MPEKYRTMQEIAYDAIRDGILAGRHGPGQRLIADDLAKELGVSRMPVREALHRLEVAGLVTITPHRGAVVSELSENECVEIYHVRAVLDGLATRLATPHLSEADETICKSCHGATVDLAGLKGQFDVNRANLQKAFDAAVKTAVGTSHYLLNSKTTAGVTTYAVITKTEAPTSVVLTGGRSVTVTFTYATPFDNGFGTSVTTLGVPFRRVSLSSTLNAAGDGFDAPLFATDGIIAKASWNLGMVNAANVIHNPSFTFQVLSATTEKFLASGGSGL